MANTYLTGPVKEKVGTAAVTRMRHVERPLSAITQAWGGDRSHRLRGCPALLRTKLRQILLRT